jgi:hypothetical protein
MAMWGVEKNGIKAGPPPAAKDCQSKNGNGKSKMRGFFASLRMTIVFL